MAEFCEGCPMRGRIESEIHQLGMTEILSGVRRILSDPYITDRRKAGILVDRDLNPSMPFWVGIETAETLCKKIDGCSGPIMVEEKKFFGKPKTKFYCPAIGRLAIRQDDDAFRIMAEQANL